MPTARNPRFVARKPACLARVENGGFVRHLYRHCFEPFATIVARHEVERRLCERHHRRSAFDDRLLDDLGPVRREADRIGG